MTLPRLTVLFLFVFSSTVFAGNFKFKNPVQQKINDTTVIRFDYKQSALFHAFTFAAIDSIVDILKKNKAVTLSIDGYAYKDEGTDTICYWISLNRALFIQTYILGRGIDSARIIAVNAFGKTKQQLKVKDKDGLTVNCRAEILVNYPPPPKKIELFDRDEDGITDNADRCPDVFGYAENTGCPDSNSVIVPFAIQEAALYSMTYKVLDSVIAVLKENPSYSINIGGHANKTEGINAFCEVVAAERADMVRLYLLSRQLNGSRIKSIRSYGSSRPLNPGKNPLQILANARAEISFIYQ